MSSWLSERAAAAAAAAANVASSAALAAEAAAAGASGSPALLFRGFASPDGADETTESESAEGLSELQIAYKRIASLEARLKGATDARRAWGLEEAELREAVGLLTAENDSLGARLKKEKEKLAKAKEAKKAAQEAAEEARQQIEALQVGTDQSRGGAPDERPPVELEAVMPAA
eukprot:scaffold23413_cov24-Tisochrysis_lutea.AAC.1